LPGLNVFRITLQQEEENLLGQVETKGQKTPILVFLETKISAWLPDFPKFLTHECQYNILR
jgi:hypothetical protein